MDREGRVDAGHGATPASCGHSSAESVRFRRNWHQNRAMRGRLPRLQRACPSAGLDELVRYSLAIPGTGVKEYFAISPTGFARVQRIYRYTGRRALTLAAESPKITTSADLKPACGRLRNPAKAAGQSAVRIAFGFPQRLIIGFSTTACAVVRLELTANGIPDHR